MAKSYIKCAADGCDTQITIIERSRKEADRKAAWYESRGEMCSECYRKQREAERVAASTKAAAEAAELGLPALQGTEKQIAWAETIRAAILGRIADIVAKVREIAEDGDDRHNTLPIFEEAASLLRGIDSSHWWIENRSGERWGYAPAFLRWLAGEAHGRTTAETVDDARAFMAGLRPAIETAPAEVVADAKAEATVRPESPKTETIAELNLSGETLQIRFLEKREDFRLLMRETLGMNWRETHWGRDLGERQGDPQDRLIEAGHRLLASGFIVLIYDADARSKAVSGEFEQEHTRWVVALKTGKFGIIWGRNEDYYAPARKLPRSSYDKPYVTTTPEHFEEVLDFAQRYDFRLSQAAETMVEQARVNRAAALVATVEAKPKAKGKRIEQENKPEPMTPAANAFIDDSLLDI